MYRTHTCGELRKHDIGKDVTLAGWVNTLRNHGGVMFIDLRDRYGITQVTLDHTNCQEDWQKANKLRSEYVIQVKGSVKGRPEDTINPQLATGDIEIEGQQLTILNESKTPPFEISKTD